MRGNNVERSAKYTNVGITRIVGGIEIDVK